MEPPKQETADSEKNASPAQGTNENSSTNSSWMKMALLVMIGLLLLSVTAIVVMVVVFLKPGRSSMPNSKFVI